jgi:diguanylate cyclase (GGDEF)-like protein
MNLDPHTLLVVNVANLMVLALTLPLMMGQNLSPSARDARLALVVQAVGWIALTLSGLWHETWPDRLLSSLSMVCISCYQYLFFRALKGWLGPRPLEPVLLVLALAMPIGYALSFDSYPVRVGWSNLLIAAQTLIVARATLFPLSSVGSRWRWSLFISMLTMAVLTAIRGVLGAWYTELYPSFEAPNPFNIAALLVANVTLVLANSTVLVAWREEAELQLRRQANTDQLTGVLNRHGWAERAADLVAQAQRHGWPLSLLVIDLDFFKLINDTHGHEAGDAALKFFGRVLSARQRGGDLIARLGGEEFAVLLAYADIAGAVAYDQRLRTELAVAASKEIGYALEFSSGVAGLAASGESLDGLMARADAALYRAKQGGRARLMVATP